MAVGRSAGIREPHDIVIDALIKTVIKYDPAIGKFKTLLRRIFGHERIDAYRKRVRIESRIGPMPDNYDPADERLITARKSREDAEELNLALSKLPRKLRRLIKLYYEKQLPIKKIACLVKRSKT